MKILTRIFGFYFNTLSFIAPKLSAKHAFYLFCYPFKAKLRPHQQDFLHTSASFKLDIEGKDVQCYTWGDGKETILFVHGWQSNSYRWKSYIESFDKSKYTLLAFDAPGHGNSESKIGNIPLYEKSISALVEKMGGVDHFIGHSIGSFACASFAFHHNYPMKSFAALASPFDAHEFFGEFNSRLTLSKKAKKHMYIYFENFTSKTVDHYSLANFSTQLKLQRTLIIHDKKDTSTSFEKSIQFSELLKKSNTEVNLIITDGLKHNLRSPEVIEAVISHVDTNCLLEI